MRRTTMRTRKETAETAVLQDAALWYVGSKGALGKIATPFCRTLEGFES
jgi:hypothetical protein